MTHEPDLTALLARLDRASVVDDVIATYQRNLPGYAALAPDLVAGPLRESVWATLTIVLALIGGNREEIARAGEDGREGMLRRFSLGVPDDDVVAGLRFGGEAVWNAVVAAARPDEVPALVRAAGRLLQFLDVLGDSAAARARELDAPVPHVERATQEVLDALLTGADLSAEHRRLAGVFGLAVDGPVRPIVVAGAKDPSRAAALLRRHGVLAAVRGDEVVGVATTAPARRSLPDEASAALGEPVARAHLGSAVQELATLALVAHRAGRQGIVLETELVPERLLASRPGVVSALVDSVLQPLETADARVDLLASLEAFVACDFDRKRAAEDLHVQPSSLAYRLDRITEITGLRFDRLDDLLALTLAVKATSAPPLAGRSSRSEA